MIKFPETLGTPKTSTEVCRHCCCHRNSLGCGLKLETCDKIAPDKEFVDKTIQDLDHWEVLKGMIDLHNHNEAATHGSTQCGFQCWKSKCSEEDAHEFHRLIADPCADAESDTDSGGEDGNVADSDGEDGNIADSDDEEGCHQLVQPGQMRRRCSLTMQLHGVDIARGCNMNIQTQFTRTLQLTFVPLHQTTSLAT